MSSVTSSTSSYMPNMMQGPGGGPRGMRQRPEASEVAEQIFSKLDTGKQGYLEADDFASAISQLARSGPSSSTASSDEVFASLDGDSDGKVTQDELASGIKSLQEQLDSQFNAMRMQGGMQGMGGGMPPPGGRGGQGQDQGLDQSQLGDMATAAAESGNTQAASLFSQLADNFDAADTDGDGKVSVSESVAYQRQQEQADSSDSSGSSESNTGSVSGSPDMQGRIAQRLMEMMRAYDDFSAPDEGNSMRSAA